MNNYELRMNKYEWRITTLRQAQGDVGSPDLDEWIYVALSLSKGGFGFK